METGIIKRYEEQGGAVIDTAESIVIVDDTTRELATEFTTKARAAIKAIEAEFKPDIEKAHQLHKDLLARMKRLTAPFKAAKEVVDQEIKRDWLEQERVKREEERAANIKAEAERIRQEQEQAAEIAELIDADNMEEAEAVATAEVVTAPIVPVAPVVRTVQSVGGSSTVRKDIKVTVADKKAVITAVFDGKLPDLILDVNVGAAKRYAKASGLMSMPGFIITEDAIISGRAR